MQERSIREKRPGTEANQSPDQQQTFQAHAGTARLTTLVNVTNYKRVLILANSLN